MEEAQPVDDERRNGMPQVGSLAELAGYVAEDVYLRFSRGPEDDRDRTSWDYESNQRLPGLSVNPLAPEDWWERPIEDWLARQVCKYLHLRTEADDDRYAWVLRGRVVSYGPDREPLVVDVEPLAWLSPETLTQAQERYRERFDVGEDSTDSS